MKGLCTTLLHTCLAPCHSSITPVLWVQHADGTPYFDLVDPDPPMFSRNSVVALYGPDHLIVRTVSGVAAQTSMHTVLCVTGVPFLGS